MRIVLDLQGCQSASRYRGIGRYSMALAQAMTRRAGGHEFWLALSSLFPDSIECIRRAFDGLVAAERVAVFQVPGPVAENNPANAWRIRAAERIREHALAELAADVVHVSSLFEGFVDDAVTSVGAGGLSLPTGVTLYDLIPLLNKEMYLKDQIAQEWYSRKLNSLKRADLLLAISESSRQEGIEALGLNGDRVINISSGVDACFRPLNLSDKEADTLRTHYGLCGFFILTTGVISDRDPRKNIERLIEAYALLPYSIRKNYSLVLTGEAGSDDRIRLLRSIARLGLTEKEVVLKGRVSDEELIVLYNLCSLFVFPSLHEGFGLPALEAMACGAPTIGSNTSSIPEVIGRADALFNPAQTENIAELMHRALTNQGFVRSLREHATAQAARFSWDESARLALEGFEELYDRQQAISTYIVNARPADSISVESGLGIESSVCGRHEAYYQALLKSLANINETRLCPSESDWLMVANSVAANLSPGTTRQLLVDISELVHRDAKTGIQRVVRSILQNLINGLSPRGYRVECVYRDGAIYRYARKFVSGFNGILDPSLEDAAIDVSRGDLFIGLDLDLNNAPVVNTVLNEYRLRGMHIYFVVYDLLLLLRPDCFMPGTSTLFRQWLTSIASISDGLIAISRAVADELLNWLDGAQPQRRRPLHIGFFHLGADFVSILPSSGQQSGDRRVLNAVASRPSMLMVGTVEPRKGYAQALGAFERLWTEGVDINLVIIGKEGWMVEALVTRLLSNSEAGHRLHWLKEASDETLMQLYESSSALLAASEGEGFGLPLIEAAQHRLPIIARDIPVFREVAGEHAFYFEGESVECLAEALKTWLCLNAEGKAPASSGISWLTWAESTQQLLNIVLENDWHASWQNDGKFTHCQSN